LKAIGEAVGCSKSTVRNAIERLGHERSGSSGGRAGAPARRWAPAVRQAGAGRAAEEDSCTGEGMSVSGPPAVTRRVGSIGAARPCASSGLLQWAMQRWRPAADEQRATSSVAASTGTARGPYSPLTAVDRGRHP
jgi:hypothetical protein